MPDRFGPARQVADAVLHEGYVLYPYRASAGKNQTRWPFGVLAPPAWATARRGERSACRTEVLVAPGADPVLHVRVRFLQVQERTVEGADGGGWHPVEQVVVDGVPHVAFAEAVDHHVDLPPLAIAATTTTTHMIAVDGGTDLEPLPGGTGRLVRRRQPLEGRVEVEVGPAAVAGSQLQVRVTVVNTVRDVEPGVDRAEANGRSLVAVHTLLAIDDGAFVSLLEPPDDAVAAAAGCRSDGCYPVLVGTPGSPTAAVVLSSPIILYDHPAVAPESAGDMFDATEIDEILALRVRTLTDAEKAEARGTDARAAAIVDRCDELDPAGLERLHGAVRSVGEPPARWWDSDVDAAVLPFEDAAEIRGRAVQRGTKVVLRPARGADAHDMFLIGRVATVAGVFPDVDGGLHVAVTVDDDPAAEILGTAGRYYYFTPEEVEPA